MPRRSLVAALALALGVGTVLIGVAPASAATVTVTSDADSGPGTLRQAVADANPGDLIEFDASVTLIELEATIELGDGIAIDGGGDVVISRAHTSAFEQFLFAPVSAGQDYVLRNITIEGIAGGEGPAIRSTDGAGFGPRDVTFSNLTVRDESAPTGPIASLFSVTGDVLVESSLFESNEATAGEGGIRIDGATGDSIRVIDSSFSDNHAEYGAALNIEYLTSTDVEIIDSIFTGNTVGNAGGAILFWSSPDSSLSVTGSTFTENSAANEGGAISAATVGDVSIAGSTFDRNSGPWGGAVEVLNGRSFTIGDSAFTGNTTTSNGGAVFAETLDLAARITGTTFTDNEAAWGGALSVDVGHGLTVRSSTFDGNRFEGQGGAIHAYNGAEGPIVIDSSTFTGQEFTGGVQGTGVSVSIDSIHPDGSLDIVNSTVDETDAAGSGIFVEESSGPLAIRSSTIRATWIEFPGIAGATGTILNSIVEAQLPGEEPVLVGTFEGGAFSTSYSIFNGPLDGDEIDVGEGVLVDTDPLLGDLDAHGGPTLTRLPATGSPAIDAGEPGFAAPPAVDQRGTGFTRVVGGRIDIGAVEVQQQTLPATGSTASWWLLAAAGGMLLAGLVLARRGFRLV